MQLIEPRLKTALELFHGGRLAESAALARALAADPQQPEAPGLDALLGELDLLANRPAAAAEHLAAALAQTPGSRRLLGISATAERRAGRLSAAAALYRDLGRAALAAKIQALADAGGGNAHLREPAAPVHWLGETRIPVVAGTLDTAAGPRAARFVIDTGVDETLLDPDLAEAAGAKTFGSEGIHFPAGPASQVEHALLPALTLGPLRLEQLPVQLHETRTTLAGLVSMPIDGIIGGNVLARCPVALDYGGRQLRFGSMAPASAGVPFYLAADGYPLLPAQVNERATTLLFLDTGMTGTGVALPLSTARQANVDLLAGVEGVGFGVRNSLPAQPICCSSLAAGGVERRMLPGMLLPEFRLERRFGFRIGGLLGDGFIGEGCLHLDYGRMRLAIVDPA